MDKLSEKHIRAVAARNVKAVDRLALCVIRIDKEGKVLKTRINRDLFVGLIAIVGPTEKDGRAYEEVILEEIGLHRTRCFASAERYNGGSRGSRTNNRKPGVRKIGPRRSWFSLSPTQYRGVGKFIFSIIQDYVDEKVGSWKPWRVHSPHRYYSRSKKQFLEGSRYLPREDSVMVSIRSDSLLAHDLHCAELLDEKLLARLQKRATLVHLILTPYLRPGRYKRVKPFEQLARVREVREAIRISKLPPILCAQIPAYLPGGEKHPFYADLSQLIGKSTTSASHLPLPDLKSRVNGTQVRSVGFGKGARCFRIFGSNASHPSEENDGNEDFVPETPRIFEGLFLRKSEEIPF